MNDKVFADKVSKIQSIAKEIYLKTVTSLKEGISEAEIAYQIRIEFKKSGIDSFWYDIPITVFFGENRFLSMAETDYKHEFRDKR